MRNHALLLPRQARDKQTTAQGKLGNKNKCAVGLCIFVCRRWRPQVRKLYLLSVFIFKKASFYQDRLGTNIGKAALKKEWLRFLASVLQGLPLQLPTAAGGEGEGGAEALLRAAASAGKIKKGAVRKPPFFEPSYIVWLKKSHQKRSSYQDRLRTTIVRKQWSKKVVFFPQGAVAEENSDGLHIAGWCNEVAAAAAAAAAAPQQGQQQEEEAEVVAASAALELTVLVVNTGTGQKTHRSLLRCHYILKMHHFTKTGSGHT